MKQMKDIAILNETDQVHVAMQQFEAFAEDHAIPMPMVMKINIVLDEIISNIIKYGFPEEDKQELHIRLTMREKDLSMIIRDNGMPFNPFQTTPPDLSKSVEEREIGGLGIHLVRQLMDDFSYRREQDSNIVEMTKHDILS